MSRYSAEFFAAHAVRALSGLSLKRRARYPSGDRKGNREGSRRTQSRSPPRNSGGPRESLSSVGVSGTMTPLFRDRIYVPNDRSYAVASHPSTMTPSSSTQDAGRHWSSSPAITGAANVPLHWPYVKTCDPVSD